MDFLECIKQTDLRYWFPVVQRSGVPYPKTVLIEEGIDLRDLISALDGQDPVTLGALVGRVDHASREVGGVPFFLRTAYLSGKHEWKNTCYCDGLIKIGRNIIGLVEATAMADQPLGCFVVREFLKLQSLFTAFDGMPVAREFRVFIRDGEVLHVQPYWPPQSIRKPSNASWRSLLGWLSDLSAGDKAFLENRARSIDIEGFWSMDFAQDVKGDWYLIDMARGELSYLWYPDRGEADPGTTGMELLKPKEVGDGCE